MVIVTEPMAGMDRVDVVVHLPAVNSRLFTSDGPDMRCGECGSRWRAGWSRPDPCGPREAVMSDCPVCNAPACSRCQRRPASSRAGRCDGCEEIIMSIRLELESDLW